MDAPKPSEEVKRSTARVRSLDDLYERLDILEAMESAPNSWDDTSSVLQTLKPGLRRSISIPIPLSNKLTVQETINVSDIMQGLEEGASASSPLSLDVSSTPLSTDKLRSLPPPPEPERLSIRRKGYKKLPSFHNTSEGLAKPLSGFVVNENPRALSSENLTRVSANTATHLRGRSEKPSCVEPLPFIRRNGASQDDYVLTKMELVPNECMEVLMENRYLSRDHQLSLSTKAPSDMSYATSSRRLKLTLNLEYESTVMTGTEMSHDGCNATGSSARRSIVDALTEPDSPLFDPALLASYEKALQELRKEDWSIADDTNDLFEKMRLTKETQTDVDTVCTLQVPENQFVLGESSEEAINPSLSTQSVDPLNDFEQICPAGGEENVVLYTTTLRGIRKTFEDCNSVRDILKSFGVGVHERDVSMHSAYRDELRELLGGQLSVPSLFIKGRYIGGADGTKKLQEEGKLAALLEGLPQDLNNSTCDGCGNMRFVPCFACSGSCKVVGQDNSLSRCLECNENGLIPCLICSFAYAPAG
ncbi:hypothetical protein L7F22_024734 [Adiantum nelumboides]|nr:hypothetical protein [Adiantum nelumboides]